MIRASLVAVIVTLAAGDAHALAPRTQPSEERARQLQLPQSSDPIWKTFAHTRISTDLARGIFLAEHPADVRALDGQVISVTGFMLSTSILKHFSTFILTRYTPVCPFCPPGAPNEAVEVDLAQFVQQTPGLVKVKGRLHLQNDAGAGLFFRLDQAQVVSGS